MARVIWIVGFAIMSMICSVCPKLLGCDDPTHAGMDGAPNGIAGKWWELLKYGSYSLMEPHSCMASNFTITTVHSKPTDLVGRIAVIDDFNDIKISKGRRRLEWELEMDYYTPAKMETTRRSQTGSSLNMGYWVLSADWKDWVVLYTCQEKNKKGIVVLSRDKTVSDNKLNEIKKKASLTITESFKKAKDFQTVYVKDNSKCQDVHFPNPPQKG